MDLLGNFLGKILSQLRFHIVVVIIAVAVGRLLALRGGRGGR